MPAAPAAALALASVLAIAGFTVLGSVFQYPQILEEPTADVLALFREHQGAVMAWFLVLVVSAALMAPAGIWLGRLTGGTLGRWIAGVGIAAATVQVVGLQRWVTLVPGISQDALDPARRAAAEDRFELWHTLLGKAIGETAGYALTATFTVLVVVALRRSVLPQWLALLGYVSAALIATGVVTPLVETASLTNFAGYVAWCVWLLAVAVVLFRVPEVRPYHGDEPAEDGRPIGASRLPAGSFFSGGLRRYPGEIAGRGCASTSHASAPRLEPCCQSRCWGHSRSSATASMSTCLEAGLPSCWCDLRWSPVRW